ncbi:MAG: MBL fold metallo-hydrolase [Bacteroidales bacterium]|jgi:glyoxylase-like metal-dependent hydrolase (beta-lactamase superfamily II)|nr:MBL fold metallo-hydrolase [Bacteroidales bacterium]
MKKMMLLVLAFNSFIFSAYAQKSDSEIERKEVFKNKEIVFYQIDERTWVGNGNMMFNESMYIIEGDELAVVIDNGTKIANLDKIIASITPKNIMMVATHVHPDHTGNARSFPEVYINPADSINIPYSMPNFKGKLKYLTDGQIIDLGARQLEVVFTPAHTPGSTTFIDKASGFGFSGDSFGSGNLLLFGGTFSQLIASCEKISAIMEGNEVEFLFPGHYHGNNPETQVRLKDLITLSKDVLSGKVKGEIDPGNSFGLPLFVSDYGVKVNYNEESLK